MFFDFSSISAKDAYKLTTACVVPRPIAWVVSRGATGLLNAAPFSFFNVVAGHPPVVCIGVGMRAGHVKDTARNIAETGEFVVNLVSESLAREMNVTAIDFPYEVNELVEAGLTTAPSVKVTPPRIAESPVALECVKHDIIHIGDSSIVLGRVLAVHVRNEFVLDAEKCYIDTPNLGLIGRLHGSGWYTRTRDRFEMPRMKAKPSAE